MRKDPDLSTEFFTIKSFRKDQETCVCVHVTRACSRWKYSLWNLSTGELSATVTMVTVIAR